MEGCVSIIVLYVHVHPKPDQSLYDTGMALNHSQLEGRLTSIGLGIQVTLVLGERAGVQTVIPFYNIAISI